MMDSTGSIYRRLHWSHYLATAGVVTAVIAVLLIWVPYRREQQIVRQFTKATEPILERDHGGPIWMRRLIGDKCMQVFDRVSSIELSDSDCTDADLALLTGLTELRQICLDGTRVTDQGLGYLQRFKHLTFVNLYGTSLTDAGIIHFHGLNNLTLLDVRGTQITPAGFEELYRILPQCEIPQ